MIKTRLNAKTSFLRILLQDHKQDQWDKFLLTLFLDPKQSYIYKLNRCLLNKHLNIHPLEGPNGLIFLATEKAELFADFLAQKFTVNPSNELPEVTSLARKIQIPTSLTSLLSPHQVRLKS